MLGSERLLGSTARVVSGFLFVALALGVSACSGDSGGNTASSTAEITEGEGSAAALTTVLRTVGAGTDYEPAVSPKELGSDAALSVVGTVEEVADGRVFGAGPTAEDEPAFLAVTMSVRVEKVLAGDASLARDGLVYVELPRTRVQPVSEFVEATVKGQRLILFLDDHSEGPGTLPLIQKAPSVPGGAPILAPYTDGLLLEDPKTGALIGGLVSLDEQPVAWQRRTDSVDAFVGEHFSK